MSSRTRAGGAIRIRLCPWNSSGWAQIASRRTSTRSYVLSRGSKWDTDEDDEHKKARH